VRGVPRTAARLSEAAAMGFRRAVVPVSAKDASTDIDVRPVRTLAEALDAAR
jgi:predicted ATP-dependent serine protease